MRKNVWFWIFLLGAALPLHGQIVITNAVFPALGDTLFYAVDNQPANLFATPPGGNQQWDFTSLQPSQTWTRIFKDPGTAAGGVFFPAATLFYDAGNGVEAFLRVTNQEVSLLGFNGGDPIGIGLDLVSLFNPPIVQSRAPVNFFDINAISSGLLLPISAAQLPDAVLRQLPVRPDSLRFRVAINRLDVVDGWGALSIPGGSFDVLREKRTEYRENRVDAKVPPLGWLDITDVAIQYLQWNSLGVDTTVTYHFLSNQSKEAIAICTMERSNPLIVRSVQYKDLDRTTGTRHPAFPGADLSVFPNPAVEMIHIRLGNIEPGSYTLVVYNLLGAEVWRKICQTATNRLEEELDLAHFDRGVYVCRVANGFERTDAALPFIFVKR